MRGWMKRLLPILLCLMILAPCALAYTTLRPGDKGSDVLKMQQALSALGYSVTCDGTFGTQTYTAVFNFQTDYGLTVDGKAGNETLTKLYELYNSMSAGTPTAAPSAQTPTATVYCANGGSLNVRRGPGTGYGVILQIPNGSTVSVIEKGTKWTQITYDSTTTGYVMTSFLRFNDTMITPTAAPTAIVSDGETAYVSCADGGSLNLRVSPQSGAKILTRVPNGAALTVTRVDGKWCYTTYNGTSGYVMSSFLYFVTTPVVTATPAVTAVPTSSGNAQSAKVQPANGGSLNLRRQPQSGNNVIAQIPYGTVLSVTPVDATWCYTTYNGNSGYVMSKFLSFTGSAATATVAPTATPTPSSETLSGYVYCANGKKLNMRSGPGTTYDVVYQIPNGAALTVTQRLSGWYAVTYESYSGYVNSSYIVLNGSAVTATPVPGKVTATPTPSRDNTIHYGELRYATVNTVNSSLNVRKTPGGKQTGSFLKGSRVVVSEILTVDGVQWAAAYQGSVSGYVQLQYLTLDARAQEDSEEDTIKQKYDTSILVRNLKSGVTGADVTLVQKRLAELGYLTSANGSYDTATVTAVKRFQKLHGLSQDGIAGQNTFSLLFSASALPYSSEASNYTSYLIDYNESENATRTEAIKRAQNALLKLNYNVATDGKFNEAMHDALVAFQLRNGINATGVLDAATQVKLYSGTAKEASAAPREYLADDAGYTANPPAKSDVKLLYWYTEVKPMMSSGTQYTVYDPESGLSWSLSVLSPGRHCDSQPTTLQDTLIMRKAFGGTSWTMHIVYVLLPDGTWCMAGMHNRPHQSNGILNNGFGGHLCVHFLRDMDECKSADPVTGVQYQNLLRDAWYELTGEKIS